MGNWYMHNEINIYDFHITVFQVGKVIHIIAALFQIFFHNIDDGVNMRNK